MALAKLTFSVGRIANYKLPTPGKRVYLYDAETPGLCLMLTSKGPQSYYLYRWIDGAPSRYRLAGFDEVTIKQARSLASTALGKIAGGANPQAQKAAARADTATLETLWIDYLENYAKLHKREKSWKMDESMWRLCLEPHAKKPLAEVTDIWVEHLHRSTGAKRGHYLANRLAALLSTMFRKRGRYFGLPKLWSPAAGLQRFPEKARARVLEGDELPRFITALAAEGNQTVRDFFWMLLLTGGRKGNVLAMKWEDISEQRKEWKIPGEVTKNGDPLRVPLADEAMAILTKREASTPWVFPGLRVNPEQVTAAKMMHKAGESTRSIARNLGLSQSSVVRMVQDDYTAPPEPGHLQDPRASWKKLLHRAGITERTTIHDIRRTWISAQIRAGANLSTVAASAGHKNIATTQKHYAIVNADVVGASVRAGVASMLGTNTPPKPEEAKKPA